MAHVHEAILAAAERCERALRMADTYRMFGDTASVELCEAFAAMESSAAFRFAQDIPTGDHGS